MELQKVDLEEVNELEPLVLKHIGEIEEGLKFLDEQITIGDGSRPDILAVDEDGSLVIIELKATTADISAIYQILRYYEWFAINLALVARSYKKVKPKEDIRLIIIAPDFDEKLSLLARYVFPYIEFKKYLSLMDMDTRGKFIIFEDFNYGEPIEQENRFRSVDDIIDYFSDDNVKKELYKILDELKSMDITIKPWKGGLRNWIECKYRDEVIGYFRILKRYFHCSDKNDEWLAKELESYDEWVSKCKKEFVATMK